MSQREEVARAARMVAWATVSGANPLIAADAACRSLGLDPTDPKDRASFLALVQPRSLEEAVRRLRAALDATGARL